MQPIRNPFRQWLNHLNESIGPRFVLRAARRRRRDLNCGVTVEALESRVCLSATPAAQAAKTGPGNSSADYLYFRTGSNQDAGTMQGLGGVALEGGGTDVSQAFQWMISRMGGKGDFLVLNATKDATYDPYIYKLGGTNSVATLDIPSLTGALDPAVKQIIENADAIFIAGGAQNDYLNFWKGTPVQQAIADDVARGVPIGGTSAGADVIGQFIYSALNSSVTSAAALANPFNSNMTFDENFVSSPTLLPNLNNTLVDTHFVTQDRTGRMIAFLARVDTNGWSPDSQPRGIGINEQTALLIMPDGTAQVIGNAKAKSPPEVDFFETPGLPQVCQPGQPLTYSPILVDRVTPGGTFNLSNWGASWQVNNAYTTHFTISVNSGVLTTTTSNSAVVNSNASIASPTSSQSSVGDTSTAALLQNPPISAKSMSLPSTPTPTAQDAVTNIAKISGDTESCDGLSLLASSLAQTPDHRAGWLQWSCTGFIVTG